MQRASYRRNFTPAQPDSPAASLRDFVSGDYTRAGTAERAHFYKWMIHLTNTPQCEYRPWFYPWQHVSGPACADNVQEASGERLGDMFDVIADQLGDGPWLLGELFSAADLFLFMLVRWGRMMPHLPRDIPQLANHARRVLARPAVQATLAAEGLREPFI